MTTPDRTWLVPDWGVPSSVRALLTTRSGGSSEGVWGGADGHAGMNLGFGKDARESVESNRQELRTLLPQEPRWLHQVHGNGVLDAAHIGDLAADGDASFTTEAGVVCVVMIADCLPVLLADSAGRAVAAAHAGWRGLACGVLQNTVRSMRGALGDSQARILAYLGPAIGPECFEVGGEVRDAMQAQLPDAHAAFVTTGPGKFHANLFDLARQALAQVGVVDIRGGTHCTYCDRARYYSFRRDGATGRQAALIWMQPCA